MVLKVKGIFTEKGIVKSEMWKAHNDYSSHVSHRCYYNFSSPM